MITSVLSADLVRYNANSAGHSAPDCVKRSISLAFDIPYTQISKELNAEMKKQGSDSWCYAFVYAPVILRHGGQPSTTVQEEMYLSEFADTIGKQGTWLVTTGPKPGKHSNHIVCVIDGVIYDSWNSSDQYVYVYYKIGHVDRRAFTDIDIHDYKDEINAVVTSTIQELLKKYPWGAYVHDATLTLRNRTDEKYRMRCIVDFTISARDYFRYDSEFDFDFYIVFTPSTTDEEAHKIIKDTAKVRVYDRLYSINQKEKKRQEAFESGGDARRPHGLSAREIRFWNTLPGRVQGIVRDITIHDPGQWHFSYEVKVDPQWGESGPVTLETYQSYEMRDLLEKYVADGTTEYDY